MKTPLLFLASLAFASLSFGQSPVPPPLVVAYGTAQVQVVPDLADLVFEVEVRDTDLAKARTLQAERATKVLAALRAAGSRRPTCKLRRLRSSPFTVTTGRAPSRPLRSATIRSARLSQSR